MDKMEKRIIGEIYTWNEHRERREKTYRTGEVGIRGSTPLCIFPYMHTKYASHS